MGSTPQVIKLLGGIFKAQYIKIDYMEKVKRMQDKV